MQMVPTPQTVLIRLIRCIPTSDSVHPVRHPIIFKSTPADLFIVGAKQERRCNVIIKDKKTSNLTADKIGAIYADKT